MPSTYVIYATTPWDGPWNVEHNIAHALAARHRVLYVDPPLSPLTPIRYGVRPDTRRRLRAVLDRRLRAADRLTVFAPLVLPPVEHPRMRALSLPLLRAQIRRAVARARMDRPVVVAWRWLPELSGVAGEALRVAVIMDYAPGGASLMGRSAAELEAQTAANCDAADVICATSHAVRELLASQGRDSELLAFGFPGDLADAFDRADPPPEYASLPRPLLGYTGGIDDRLDFDLLVRLADRFREGSLVFVGAVSPRLSPQGHAALASRPNIHLLGPRPRPQLPAYIRYLDVALMPYADSTWIRHAAPLKLWEYLYAGPPIVGTGAQDLRRYPPPLVNYAETGDVAVQMVERAAADRATGRDERRAFALENTWEDRANQLDALVEDRLRGSGSAVSRATGCRTALQA